MPKLRIVREGVPTAANAALSEGLNSRQRGARPPWSLVIVGNVP